MTRRLLSARWGPRLGRAIAALLALLPGALTARAQSPEPEGDPPPGGREGQPAGPGEGAPLLGPEQLDAKLVERWYGDAEVLANVKGALVRWEAGASSAAEVEGAYGFEGSPASLQWLVRAVAAADRPALPAARIQAAIEELAARAWIDPWLAGFLFRQTARLDGPPAARRDAFSRLREYVRLTEAFPRALAASSAFRPRPWMSKAGPTREHRERQDAWTARLPQLAAALRQAVATTDLGPWAQEGGLHLQVLGARPWLVRGTARVPLLDGTRVGRLDLLEVPQGGAVVEHAWLGRLTLPAGGLLSVWDLPPLLSPAGREALQASLASALRGDEAEALRLEGALPLVHVELKRALRETPGAPGAPRLRMILALFDEVLLDGAR